MAKRKHIPEAVLRVVFMRAFGRCEYFGCTEVVARCDEAGKIQCSGEFCHILPSADGPRAEFANDAIDRESAQNLILLCRIHHRLIDHEARESHPPALLFEMADRKHQFFRREFDEVYARNPLPFGHDELMEDIRIGRIFTLINDFLSDGPKLGRKHLRTASGVIRSIEKNPYLPTPREVLSLLKLQLVALGLIGNTDRDSWRDALATARRLLGHIEDPLKLTSAVLLMMEFARDEHHVLREGDRGQLIRTLIERLDAAMAKGDIEDRFRALLLTEKAALLRWKGRLQSVAAQSNIFLEAERCANKSQSIIASPATSLQLALIKVARARSLPMEKLKDYDREIQEASEIILSKDLDTFGAAVKYRPQFLRDHHRFEEAVTCFGRAVDAGHLHKMQENAFVLSEASTAKYITAGQVVTPDLDEVHQFLTKSIRLGFDHGRNFMAWIVTRALLDPAWFREDVVDRMQGKDQRSDLIAILSDQSRRYLDSDATNQDVLFGVDDVEFWNMMARTCRVALDDPELALEYYETAERYAMSVGGNFTTKVGFVRSYIRLGRAEEARRYYAKAQSRAKAHQSQAVAALLAEIRQAFSVGEHA